MSTVANEPLLRSTPIRAPNCTSCRPQDRGHDPLRRAETRGPPALGTYIMTAFHRRPACASVSILQNKGMIVTENGRRARVPSQHGQVFTTLDGVVNLMISQTRV